MSPWPFCGRSCPSTKVMPSTPFHIWFLDGLFGESAGRWFGVAWFCCRTETRINTHVGSVYCLPAPGTSSVFTGHLKVGQRFTVYSTSLLEHISTSLLDRQATPLRLPERVRKRGTSMRGQMSLAVTVPLITGFQTECGEAGCLPCRTTDSRQQ